MSDCIFCKIVRKEIPGKVLWEDENYIAFLDIFPNNFGQTLVIPKLHEDYVFNLDDEVYKGLMLMTKGIAESLKSALDVKRICIKVEGFEVPHVHVKLYPTNEADDLRKESYKASEEELEEAIKKISTKIN